MSQAVRSPFAFLLLVLFFLTSAVHPAQAGSLSSGLSDPGELDGFLDGLFAAQMKNDHVPGAVVAVVKDEAILYRRPTLQARFNECPRLVEATYQFRRAAFWRIALPPQHVRIHLFVGILEGIAEPPCSDRNDMLYYLTEQPYTWSRLQRELFNRQRGDAFFEAFCYSLPSSHKSHLVLIEDPVASIAPCELVFHFI